MDPVEVRRLYRDIKIPTKLLIRQPDEKKSKKKKAKAAATAAATENGSGPDSPSINGRTMEAEVKQYFWAIFIILLYNYSLLWVLERGHITLILGGLGLSGFRQNWTHTPGEIDMYVSLPLAVS